MRLFVVSVALLVAVVAACSERQAQLATQTSLNALAEARNGTYKIARAALPEAQERARAQVRAEVEEGSITEVEQGMERYAELMRVWEDLQGALDTVDATLLLGQSAVDLWIAGSGLPDTWGDFCDEIETALERLIGLLDSCGLEDEIPDALRRGLEHASTACVVAAGYFSGGGDDA